MIAVIDIGTGNLRSVIEALRRVNAPGKLIKSAPELEGVNGILLPGVGAFGEAMRRLHAQGLAEPIRAAALAGTPVLGICLGMQLLADVGFEHGRADGLGLIPGEVVPLVPRVNCERVPNMGWRKIQIVRDGDLLDASCRGEHFFFAHSFHLVPNDRTHIVASIDGGIVASVQRGNVFGAQFHPEKSQDAGLNLLARFAAVVESGGVKPSRRRDAA